MEWIINKINVEVDELVSSCKLGTSEIITSIEEIKDSAKKSIEDISNVHLTETIKSITQPNPPLPRI